MILYKVWELSYRNLSMKNSNEPIDIIQQNYLADIFKNLSFVHFYLKWYGFGWLAIHVGWVFNRCHPINFTINVLVWSSFIKLFFHNFWQYFFKWALRFYIDINPTCIITSIFVVSLGYGWLSSNVDMLATELCQDKNLSFRLSNDT